MGISSNILGVLKKATGAAKIGRAGSTVDADLTTLENTADSHGQTLTSHGQAISDNANVISGNSDSISTLDQQKAPLASPTFTGAPKAPTPADAAEQTEIANAAWVRGRLAELPEPEAPGMELLETVTISVAVASVEFTDLTGYAGFIVEMENFLPETDSVAIAARVSNDNGATWISTSTYGRAVPGQTNSTFVNSYMPLCGAIGSAATPETGASGYIKLMHPETAGGLRAESAIVSVDPSSEPRYDTMGISMSSPLGPYDAVQLYFTSGNIASGTVRLYGVKK